MSKKTERKAIDKVFILLGAAATIMLLVIASLAWYGHNFATSMVRDELSSQKIYFPTTDSQAFKSLDKQDQDEMAKYAGELLTTGEQAKVYANNYIGAHLKDIADGKTYAEVSSESMKDPENAQLQGQKAALFQGETLRGMLLGTGYAFWTFGMIALYISIASLIGAVLMFILVILGVRHLAKLA